MKITLDFGEAPLVANKNGHFVLEGEISDEQMRSLFPKCAWRKLEDYMVGEHVSIGSWDCVVLDHFQNGTTLLITNEIVGYQQWIASDDHVHVLHPFNYFMNTKYSKVVSDAVDTKYQVAIKTSAQALDGTYQSKGDIRVLYHNAQLMPLDLDMYRKYHHILPKIGNKDVYWLSTVASYADRIISGLTIRSDGTIECVPIRNQAGIRPAFLLKSDVCVAPVELLKNKEKYHETK